MDTRYALASEEIMDKKVRLKARLDRVIYPKTGQSSGTWTIAAFNLLEVLDGDVPPVFLLSNHFTAKGRMPALNTRDEYTISARLVKDEKYGLQYEIDTMCLDYDMDDEEDQRKFFSFSV